MVKQSFDLISDAEFFGGSRLSENTSSSALISDEAFFGGTTEPIEASFTDSMARGVDLAQGMGYGFLEATGEAIGSDTVKDFGREGRERNMVEMGANPRTQNFTDINGFGDAWDWAKETAGEQIPMMAPSVAGGAAGVALTSWVPVPGARLLGGLVGAFVPSLVLGSGETQMAIKEKDPNVEAPGMAFAGGSAIAALDSILPGKIGGRLVTAFGAEVGEQVAKKALSKRMATEAVKGMTLEGVTEAVQESISEAAAAHGTGQEIDWTGLEEQMIEAGAAGALMGGGANVATEVGASMIQSGQPQSQEDPQQQIDAERARIVAEGEAVLRGEEVQPAPDLSPPSSDAQPLEADTPVSVSPGAPMPEGTGERHAPVKAEVPVDVDLAAQQADTAPSDAQKKYGNYRKGHVKVQGLDIAIENPKGSVRSGTDEDGKAWKTVMRSHYGYIKTAEGADGDKVDVFVNTDTDQIGDVAYVVDQVVGGTFDEHKVVLGAGSEAEARALYNANYAPDWDGIGAITPLPMDEFKSWLKDGNTKKPLAWAPQEQSVPLNDELPADMQPVSREPNHEQGVPVDGVGLDTVSRETKREHDADEMPPVLDRVVREALSEVRAKDYAYDDVEGVVSVVDEVSQKDGLEPSDARIQAITQVREQIPHAPADNYVRRKDGRDFSTEKSALLAARNRTDLKGKAYKPVQVDGGWALMEGVDAPEESAKSIKPDQRVIEWQEDAYRARNSTMPKRFKAIKVVSDYQQGFAAGIGEETLIDHMSPAYKRGLDSGKKWLSDNPRLSAKAQVTPLKPPSKRRQMDMLGAEDVRDTDMVNADRAQSVIDELMGKDYDRQDVIDVLAIAEKKDPDTPDSMTQSYMQPILDRLHAEKRTVRAKMRKMLQQADHPPMKEEKATEPVSVEKDAANQGEKINTPKIENKHAPAEQAGVSDSGEDWQQRIQREEQEANDQLEQGKDLTAKQWQAFGVNNPQSVSRREAGSVLMKAGIWSKDQQDAIIEQFRKSGKASAFELYKAAQSPFANPTTETVTNVVGATEQGVSPGAEKISDKPLTLIEDFGEVLHGARKHYAQAYKDKIDAAMEDDIASEPLSKTWPEPDYQKLLDEGSDPWIVAFVHAARDEIPNKPRQNWKLKQYVSSVTALRGFSNQILDGGISKETLLSRLNDREYSHLRDKMSSRVELYMAVGHKKSLKGVSVHVGSYSLYGGIKYTPPRTIWSVQKKAKATAFSNWPRELSIGETKEEALNNFKMKYDSLEINKPSTKEVKFDIYSYQSRPNETIIGKKVGRNTIDLKTFETTKEARLYLSDHHDELVKVLEKKKFVPNHRSNENQTRVGDEHRNGADATPEMFSDAFGFRGVQFGNYVEGAKRQQDLNEAYDGLMDLAGVLGVPSKALSLNGELGLAFGARGKGGKGAPKAHFERDTVIINLTKRKGAGSLAHEWWHSLDNHFSRAREDKHGYVSEKPYERGSGVRPEMVSAFKGVVDAIKDSGVPKRSLELDKRRTKTYWGVGREMSARSFESYVIAKLQDNSQSNEYLANVVSEDYWKAAEALGVGEGVGEGVNSYPYPNAAEIPAVRAAFDNFFDTIEHRETDKGVEMFSVFNDPDWTGVAQGLDWKVQTKVVEIKKQYEEIEDASDVRRLANQEISASDGILGEYQNLDTGWDIHLYAKGIRKTLSGEGSKIRAALAWKLPDLLKHAILVETVSDKKTRADIGRVHRFYAAAQMDGDVRRIKITVREHNDGVKRQYDIDHLDIEKPGTGLSPSNDRTTSGVGSIPLPGSSISIRQLLDGVNSEVDGQPVLGRGESHAVIAEYDWKTSVDREELAQKIITISKRIAPKVKVQVVDELLGNVPGRGSIPVTGVHRAAQNLIEVAIDLGNPEKTIRHEGIHALYAMGLISKTEHSILSNKARREWIAKYKIDDLYPKATKEQKIEEAIAQASAEYGYGEGKFPPGIRRILDKIKQFLERLGNALKRMGYQSVEDIFERVESGKVGKRETSTDYRDGAAGDKYMAAAYHGSPHDFDTFSTDNIGNGEGHQAFGWGLYFAGNKEVADFYQNALGGNQIGSIMDRVPEYYAPGNIVPGYGGFDKVLEYIPGENYGNFGVKVVRVNQDGSAKPGERPRTHSTIPDAKDVKAVLGKGYGNLYEVNLAPAEDEYLYWDKPLSEQSEKVQKALKSLRNDVIEAWQGNGAWEHATGENLYRHLADGLTVGSAISGEHREASMLLNDAGIPGIKYLDGSSRSKGEGHYNYVIFDASHVEVTDKYSLFEDDVVDEMASSEIFADGTTDRADTEFKKHGVLRKITNDLKEHVTAPAIPHARDLNWFQKALVHPRMIAEMFPKFTPVWRAAEKQFHRRDTINAMLTRILEPYHKLSEASKLKVHKVLEIARLEGGSIDSPMVGVTNQLGDAALSEKGEHISLTKEESEAYHAVRKSMDKALDLYKEQVLREWGFGKDGDPTTAKDLEAHAKELYQEAKKAEEPEDARDMNREADSARQVAQLVAEIEQAKKSGYVPFTRFGEVSISVRDKGNNLVHFEKIEVGGAVGRLVHRKKVMDARRKLMAKYPKSKGYDVEKPRQMVNSNDLAAAGIKIGDVDALAELGRVEGAEWEAVREQLNEASKKVGFRKHFIGAKNTAGYSTDFERSIADYVTGISSYLARREARPDMETALAQISDKQTNLRDYATAYNDYVQSPKESLQWLRSLNFFYYLSGNISSAMVNLTQVPLATMPYLSQFSPAGRINIEMTRAYKDLAKMAIRKPTMDGGAVEFFDPAKAPEDVREDLQTAWDDGTLVPLVTMEQMGVAHGSEKFRRGFSKGTQATVEFAGSLFTGAERANRIVTFIAAHRLARRADVMDKANEVLKDNALWASVGTKPVDFAEWVIDETHFVLGKRNRPTWFRDHGAWPGTAVFQFRGFSVNYLELMWRMARQNGPQGKKAFAMVAGALIASAGVWGLPFGDDLKDIVEAMYAWIADRDIDLEAELRTAVYETTGSSLVAEAVNRGGLRMTGADMSRRLGMGSILPTDSFLSLFGVKTRNGGEVFGVPMDMTFGRIRRIGEHLKNGDVGLAGSEALPAFAKNPVQAYFWSADGIKSGGVKVIDPEDLTDMDVVMKAFGFTPTSVTRRREQEWTIYRDQQAMRDLTSRYYKKLAKAAVAGDGAKMTTVRQEIIEYNQGRPAHEQIRIYPPSLKQAVKREAMGYDARLGKGPKKSRVHAAELRDVYPD